MVKEKSNYKSDYSSFTTHYSQTHYMQLLKPITFYKAESPFNGNTYESITAIFPAAN